MPKQWSDSKIFLLAVQSVHSCQLSKVLSSCLQEQVKLKESALAAVREGAQAELNLVTQSTRATETKLAKVPAPSDAPDDEIVSPHALFGYTAIHLLSRCSCRTAVSLDCIFKIKTTGHCQETV